MSHIIAYDSAEIFHHDYTASVHVRRSLLRVWVSVKVSGKLPESLEDFLSAHHSPLCAVGFRKGVSKSRGIGKIVMEEFSEEISVRVCK